jgi:hypothetical protein
MIMQDDDTNSTPIEGELTDEDLEHVSGGWGPVNGTCLVFKPNLKPFLGSENAEEIHCLRPAQAWTVIPV